MEGVIKWFSVQNNMSKKAGVDKLKWGEWLRIPKKKKKTDVGCCILFSLNLDWVPKGTSFPCAM